MKLLFIRHGDPNYVTDSLTERGKLEAEALSKHIEMWKIDDVYLSPLGRAQETASYSLKKLGKTGITYPWLREFNAQVDINLHPELFEAFPDTEREEDGTFQKRICWDVVPSYMAKHPGIYQNPGWRDEDICVKSDVLECYDLVCDEFDKLLADYGYVREGTCYKVEKECDKTIAFFCHYGVTSIILSHLYNTSPYSLLAGTILCPTSVTLVNSEERQQGTACFRTMISGDITHLTLEGIEPSFAGRFAEVYSDSEARH